MHRISGESSSARSGVVSALRVPTLFACLLLAAACGKSSSPPASDARAPAPAGTPEIYPRDLVEAKRGAIAGGQVVLADDPAFASAEGFGDVAGNDGDWLMERWTIGPRQVLEWAGPATPGAYDVNVYLWRPHPLPEETIEVRYRIAGEEAWRAESFGVNGVLLHRRVELDRAGAPLRFEMEAPTFVPADSIPGASDPRPLGMIFSHIEVVPASDASAAPAAETAAETP